MGYKKQLSKVENFLTMRNNLGKGEFDDLSKQRKRMQVRQGGVFWNKYNEWGRAHFALRFILSHCNKLQAR